MTKHKVLEQAKTERKHYSPELKQGERDQSGLLKVTDRLVGQIRGGRITCRGETRLQAGKPYCAAADVRCSHHFACNVSIAFFASACATSSVVVFSPCSA